MTAMAGERIGVLLLNLGGPDRPESVKPFLRELFRDPDVLQVPGGPLARRALAWWIATVRTPQVIRNYLEVGWSPLLPRTQAQERALERALNHDAGVDGGRFVVRTAMRYWHPRAERAVAELLAAGCTRVVALPLYPHYSRATTGSSLVELRAVLRRMAPHLPLTEICSYAREPGYVTALARRVAQALEIARTQAGTEPFLLFSAHGLPQRIVDGGDPYVTEIEATRTALLATLGWKGEQQLAFQSRAGPVKWLEPSTEHALAALARRGVRNVVVVPISFVSDHIETVHELDVVLGRQARAQGITTFVRAPALDVGDDFIGTLARLVRGNLGDAAAALQAESAAERRHVLPA